MCDANAMSNAGSTGTGWTSYPGAPLPIPGPLSGVTVVSLEQAVAAPFATRQLADLGARVIKIERPVVGDFARGYDTTVNGLASHFVWTNRSKESLTLDLKRPEGKWIVEQLLERSDVFVQNLAPGAVERLGFGATRLREQYDRLIVCDISGYGSSGPYRDKKAYDLLIQCETGVVSITGTPDEPAKVGISVADIAGGMYAFSGILTALYARATTGQGAHLEISLFDALAEWMGYPAYYTAYSGSQPPRGGAGHPAIAPYGPVETRDGSVFIAIQNEREWARLCADVLNQPALSADDRFATNSLRVANRPALDAILAAAFSDLPATEVESRLDRAGIANARLRTVLELLQHPQLAARDRWTEVASPAGAIRALVPPIALDGAPHRMDAIPSVGQHTDAILRELGYDDGEIERLAKDGVI
jgi:crotonobetainyl-CoA:carnitine CoA-transferase CaiB-like acyl-CoA transferase